VETTLNPFLEIKKDSEEEVGILEFWIFDYFESLLGETMISGVV
jgi:hypothetical protein